MAEKQDVPFSVRLKEIKNPNAWSCTGVTILDEQGREIGGYERSYPSYGDTTFRPFFLHGRWWALYSRDYTATRVMTLPDCEDWCGEEENGAGFCPVDYYVPRYLPAKWKPGEEVFDVCIGEGARGWDDPGKTGYFDIGAPQYCPFGLVAGCIWGDDSSWKVEWLDLSRLPGKEFAREPRFGYVELLGDLKDSIDMGAWRPDEPDIAITGKRWLNSDTGKSEFPVNI